MLPRPLPFDRNLHLHSRLARIAHLVPFAGADVARWVFAGPLRRAAWPRAGGPPGPASGAAAAPRPSGQTLRAGDGPDPAPLPHPALSGRGGRWPPPPPGTPPLVPPPTRAARVLGAATPLPPGATPAER